MKTITTKGHVLVSWELTTDSGRIYRVDNGGRFDAFVFDSSRRPICLEIDDDEAELVIKLSVESSYTPATYFGPAEMDLEFHAREGWIEYGTGENARRVPIDKRLAEEIVNHNYYEVAERIESGNVTEC